jgi:hypothetical protein
MTACVALDGGIEFLDETLAALEDEAIEVLGGREASMQHMTSRGGGTEGALRGACS